jgi:NAD(P)-dependent dehydrogenase (short-subunit alcohol dehydrogenase family)
MNLELKGKRALVTGGSSGIGLACARELALEGADVAIAARTPQKLSEATERLKAETGARIMGVSVDTGNDASVAEMVASVADAFGGLDILVNSAAVPGGGRPAAKLAEITDDLFYAHINVKVMGYLRCAREAAPHMIKNGWGRIINVSGLAAREAHGIVGSVRNVSVSAMSKNLADELGEVGINVTVVHPGLTRTERTGAMLEAYAQANGVGVADAEKRMSASTSIARMVDATEIAYVVTFLASPRSIAISGDAIPVAGGRKGAIHY